MSPSGGGDNYRNFRARLRAERDQELRHIICGRCGQESAALDGPTGRAWFASHTCLPSLPSRQAVVIPFPTRPKRAA